MKRLLNMPGFTLIEVIVCLFILLIVGTLVSSELNFIVRSKDSIEKKSRRLGHLQEAVMTIEDDLHQIRHIPAATGNLPEPVLILSPAFLQFVRSDYSDPHAIPSSRRISYLLSGTTLVRATAAVLSGELDATPAYRVLLKNVRAFSCRMMPDINPLTHPLDRSVQDKNIPTGILIDINTPDYGHIVRIIPLTVSITDTVPNAAF